MKYCGFNNGITISQIGDVDIQDFVEQVQNGKVTKYFKPIIGDKDVLEGSTQTEKDFEFSRGHLKLLMTVVEFLKHFIQENGLESIIEEVEPTSQTKKSKTKEAKKNPLKKPFIPKKKIRLSAAAKTALYESHKHLILNTNAIEEEKGILIMKMLVSLAGQTPTLYLAVSMFSYFEYF